MAKSSMGRRAGSAMRSIYSAGGTKGKSVYGSTPKESGARLRTPGHSAVPPGNRNAHTIGAPRDKK